MEAILKKIIVGEKDQVIIQALVKELSIDFRPGFYLVVVIQVGSMDHDTSRYEVEFFTQVRLFQKIEEFFTTSVISVFKTKEDEVTVVLFTEDQNRIAAIIVSCTQLNDVLKEVHTFTCMIGVGGFYNTATIPINPI